MSLLESRVDEADKSIAKDHEALQTLTLKADSVEDGLEGLKLVLKKSEPGRLKALFARDFYIFDPIDKSIEKSPVYRLNSPT